jgi:hypothetical protein
MENWSPALLTTLKGYGLYCAKHVGPTCTSDGTIPPTLKGLPLQQDPFGLTVNSSKATPTPPFDSLLRAALVSPSLGLTSCVAAPGDTKVTNATPGDTEPQSTLTGGAQHVAVEKIDPMASNAIVPPTGASDQSGSAPPTTVKPVPAASKVLDPNLKSRLAKLRTTLTEARHTKSGALVWALGQVMCFMLPKQTDSYARQVGKCLWHPGARRTRRSRIRHLHHARRQF